MNTEQVPDDVSVPGGVVRHGDDEVVLESVYKLLLIVSGEEWGSYSVIFSLLYDLDAPATVLIFRDFSK
jgi:hypothetical protein